MLANFDIIENMSDDTFIFAGHGYILFILFMIYFNLKIYIF